MYKKSIQLLIFILLLLLTTNAAYQPANVTINDRTIYFASTSPITLGNRTLVSVREVFEELNFTVRWQDNLQQIFMQNDRYTVVIIIGHNTFYINGTPFFLETPAQKIAGSVMAPLRMILEAMGYSLSWCSETRTIQINTGYNPRNFIYFYQRDPRWADVPFGSFTTARGGCGPTSLAMVVSTLHGENIYPCYVVTWGSRFYVDGIGAAHALFTSEITHRHFGLTYRPISIYNDDEVLEALRGGALLVTSVQAINSPNARTGAQGLFVIDPMAGGGHVAVIYGVTDYNRVLLASPMHTALLNNTEGWTLDTVRNEVHRGTGQFWSFTAETAKILDVSRCHIPPQNIGLPN